MKKILLILTLIAGVSMKGEAQHFTASFGVTHSWGFPTHVTRVISHDYHGYDVVHARRFNRGGHVFFDVILQRGDVYVEVDISNHGHIDRYVSYDYYPLNDHVCSNYCGYHDNYYRSHYRACGSHSHHGHNHVVYINRGHGHHGGHGHGHHGGHGHGNHYKQKSHYTHSGGKHHGKGHGHNYKSNHSNSREYNNSNHNNYRERRSTYHEERGNGRGRSQYQGNSRGRSDNNSRPARGTYVRRNN